MAESEFSVLLRQCLGRRIPDQESLIKEIVYRSCFKNWEFDKETFKILCSERVTIAREARREREQEF